MRTQLQASRTQVIVAATAEHRRWKAEHEHAKVPDRSVADARINRPNEGAE